MRISIISLLLLLLLNSAAQPPLTVANIMKEPKWIGSSPSQPRWSVDGTQILFYWNPTKAAADSLYRIVLATGNYEQLTTSEKQQLVTADDLIWNSDRSACVYERNGDIFYRKVKTNQIIRVTQTTDTESNSQFSFDNSVVTYVKNNNAFAWHIATGSTQQLTNFISGNAPANVNALNKQEQWLQNDQLQWMQVVRERKQNDDATKAYNKNARITFIKPIYTGDKNVIDINVSPNGQWLSYRLFKSGSGKNTIVPNYVTESGFTTDIPARTKVGHPQPTTEIWLYDRLNDTSFMIKADSLPGIYDIPNFLQDYPKQLAERTSKPQPRAISWLSIHWNNNGTAAIIQARAQDNKDRWLILFNALTGKYECFNRQHDDAWIAGPGINSSSIGWISNNECWFQSEVTGYSHLYTYNLTTQQTNALTSGNYEVQKAVLSITNKYFFITTNEVHPGEQHLYKLYIGSGKKERITQAEGAWQWQLSPDEKQVALLYSNRTQPWELYVQATAINSTAKQLTFKATSDSFLQYRWQQPEVVSITAADGATMYARIYKPEKPHPNKPAVLFVHGAGYLQNAHKWWSSYFREFMFNNLLAAEGYYVLDVDYRGSAGYGRNWRTGIYRHMGGKDLSDHTDAIQWLVKTHGVNPKNIGIYGGSYGGFITLMALFTQPNVYAAGAALRPVTDWAQYNHGYTSNILNEPFSDSIAYRRSSPLYFAEGLRGHLLICHGMVDVNVHFQDAVKLSQRLIELEKDNWELAAYPMEDHGFIEPSSWTDEYKRIHKLFKQVLLGQLH
ncbi:MAG: prolyl oligopeptidase family serine peptidase [Chitinophagaceae bacterium]